MDDGLSSGIVLTDLSKAFDSISHDLLIAKLNAYGFSNQSLNIITNYLSDRKQRTKINDTFSTWRDIVYGVPQGSILGPLLFNIYMNDLFLFSSEFNIANYADDCSPYTFSGSIDDVINKLESHSHTLIKWYENNYLKPNPDKWHLILSKPGDEMKIMIGNQCISNSSCEKMLGINFDNKLTFNSHINKICRKAGQKLHALARISGFMSINQRKVVMNAFISSHFNYCPLIWMFSSRSLNAQINRIQERALRIVYNDNVSSFEELLEISQSITIHHRNIQLLAVEIYKAVNNLAPTLMIDMFQTKKVNYNLRKDKILISRNVKTVYYGTESISYLAPKIWEIIPNNIKNCENLNSFKSKIKSWIPHECPCRICKIYLPNLGFI